MWYISLLRILNSKRNVLLVKRFLHPIMTKYFVKIRGEYRENLYIIEYRPVVKIFDIGFFYKTYIWSDILDENTSSIFGTRKVINVFFIINKALTSRVISQLSMFFYYIVVIYSFYPYLTVNNKLSNKIVT